MSIQSRPSQSSFAGRRARNRDCQPSHATRRGSTLMVVMVLMGMLSLLGVIFYTFAAQERSNANYYAEAAKVVSPSSLTADVLFDWALEQIIVGTDQRLTNSMLWGSRYSMLSNELGYGYHRPGDQHAFNGEGMNFIYNSNGVVDTDQDRDGVGDSLGTNALSPNVINFVDSPAAQNTIAQQALLQTGMQRNLTYNEDTNGNWILDKPPTVPVSEDQNGNGVLDRFPQSDVGYTYPDVNNLFVAYVGKMRDSNGNIHRIVKPSYLAPGVFRSPTTIGGVSVPSPLIFEDANFNGVLDTGEDLNGNGHLDDWCVNPLTVSQSMRAHVNHLYVPATSTAPSTVPRYLSETEATSLIGGSAHGFPFHPMDPTYSTNGGAGLVYNLGRMGPYSTFDTSGTNPPPGEFFEFDYDNDQDGIREAILMDLDFPAQQDSSGKLFVPMYLITIHDMDSLINLNAHGNLSKVLLNNFDIADGLATTSVSSKAGQPFGYDTNLAAFDWISKSNLGLGPSEVNPAWALNGRPLVDAAGGYNFSPHTSFFGNSPANNSPTPVWGEAANMELLWAKIGRNVSLSGPGGSIPDVVPGAYGEEGLLFQALNNGTVSFAGGSSLPRPGVSFGDDNSDITEGQSSPSSNPYFISTSWDFQHPIDWTGQGSYYNTSTMKTMNWAVSGANQWIQYNKYGNSAYGTGGNVRWGQNGYMSGSILQGLGDDPYETNFYPLNAQQAAVDNLFDPSENLYLQLSNTENLRIGNSSRLSTLVPFNFGTTTNTRGQSIRQKFTTESNDRKNYSLPVSPRTLGVTPNIGANSPPSTPTLPLGQEYSLDNTPPPLSVATAAQPYLVVPPYNILRFPPEFGNAATTYVNNAVNGTSNPATYIRRYQIYQSGGGSPTPADPFRPITRAILESDNNYAYSVAGIQQRLSVNKLLTYDPVTLNPILRNLTPHPDDPGTTVIDAAVGANPAYPPVTAAGEEYWARLDRQQLCRDIYVMLYLLGHGDDTVNTAQTTNLNPLLNSGLPFNQTLTPQPFTTTHTTPPVYSEPQLREMAQFAVNMVDAMDRDNVITRFEYDKDLSDGWNLDDDATTNEFSATVYANPSTNYNANYPNDSAARGEVFGVESLDLTLNESLIINTTAITNDTNNTGWNDTTSRNFAYVELYNRSPQSVTFNNSAWQIVLKQDAKPSATPPVPGFERRFIPSTGAGSIGSGSLYTIASADTNQTGTTGTSGRSRFMVDPKAMGSLISITPIVTSPNGLDLVDESTNGTLTGKGQILDQNNTDLTGTLGSWANGFAGAAPLSNTVRVILRRRASLTRSALSVTNVNDNPWVDVDTMTINFTSFNLTGGTTQAVIDAQLLSGAASRERPQPLDRGNENANASGGVNFIYNSLTSANSNISSPYTIWHPHFDREFSSIGELFMVPVYAPYQLTMAARSAQFDSPEKQVSNTAGNAALTPDWPNEAGGAAATNALSAKTAAAKFMAPEDPQNYTTVTSRNYDNRWHRLLEFIEVSTRTNINLGIGTDIAITRVPGKMNPNMLRFPDNYAALLDEGRVALLNLSPTDVPVDGTTDPIATIDDQLTEFGFPDRDWWQQFVLSRDGHDPYVYSQYSLQAPIPGLLAWPSYNVQGTTTSSIGARPFRSLADIRYNPMTASPGGTPVTHASIEETMLRSLPFDMTVAPDPISSTSTTRRRLMEIGLQADHNGGSVDPMIRNRLLSKVWGNTTMRSNCYAVFISVKYFSAANVNGAIRIGGPYNGNPTPEHRGFFVVDRSKLEKGKSTNTSGYDFRAFVDYRKTLATQ